MGEHLKYNLKNKKGLIVFAGSMEEIAKFLEIPLKSLHHYYFEGKRIKGEYVIVPFTSDVDSNITPQKIKEHLWDDKGRRLYDYKKGYPNRYKDASCRRFTPL